ncbi:MAG: protein kinase domain-containing protein [Planctomycetota bacterium]
MSEQQFHRIEELFQAAADLPVDQRAGFLKEACGGDPALEDNVLRLLKRLDRDTSMVTPGSGGDQHIGPFPAVAITEGPGTVIDRYKLLQVIGDGGFGVVYMAEQLKPIIRKVALKIIKLGMDTREVVARFEAERQALAMMDHPNIAKVLDGGSTKSGRPYFVMELVKGTSITDFCDKNDLPTRSRLDLFLRVCQAVQHAHQKGVIHRDLKPSNVLVTLHDGAPMPKVIDFGIAKAMHTRLTEKTLFTRFEQFVGTPAYMSPEQAEMSALDVDTRTDIYSLGVLLYELLTGTTPFDAQSLGQAGLMEIQRIIREEQPPRPSKRVSTTGDLKSAQRRGIDVAGLCKQLRGDLDWIVMKSLEKDRSRRYNSAGEFAEDVRRHLCDEPVVAGPPRTSYKLKKFLARNKAIVITSFLVTAALIIGIITTTSAMVQAERNARTASEQADRALTAVDFLLSTLSLADPNTALDPEVTVLTLLEHTSAQVETAFANDPGTEVRVRATIGKAYSNLGKPEMAEPHLRRVIEMIKVHDESAVAISPELRPSGFNELEYADMLWTMTNVCFNLERPDSFAMAGLAHQVGVGYIRETEPRLAALLFKFMDRVKAGSWSHAEDAMDGVRELFVECTNEADAVLETGDPRWPIVSDLYMSAGYSLWYTPHEPLGEDFWKQALIIQQRELPSNHPATAATIGLLVGILNKSGKLEESEALIQESIESLQQVHRKGSFALARARSMLGETLLLQDRFEEAEPLLLGSYQSVLSSVKNEHNWMVLETANQIVRLYHKWGRPDLAEPYRDTLAAAASSSRHIMQWSFSRGAFGPQHERFVAAADQLRELCGGVSFLATPGAVKSANVVPAVTEFVDAGHAELPLDDPRSAISGRLLVGWANALDPIENKEARCLMATEAIQILEKWSDRIPLDYAEAAAVMSECMHADGDAEAARRYAGLAWRSLDLGRPTGQWFMVSQEIRVARCLLQQEMFSPAEKLLHAGYTSLAKQLGKNHVDTVLARSMLEELYTRSGRTLDAAQLDAPATESQR